MVNIVLHAILLQPFEYQGVYVLLKCTKQPRTYDVLRKELTLPHGYSPVNG